MEEGARREQRGEGGGTGLALTTLLRHQKTARLRLQVVVNEMAHDVAVLATSGGGEQRAERGCGIGGAIARGTRRKARGLGALAVLEELTVSVS